MSSLINSLCNFTLFLFFFGQTPVYETYSKNLICQFRTETLIPRGMKISSIGGSSDKGIKMIHLGVDTCGLSDVHESRKVLVDLVEKLLKLYNEDKHIRSFLLDYPFTFNNLEFEISFLNQKGGFWIIQDSVDPTSQITYVTLHKGKVRYEIYNGEQISPLRTVFSESYEEALKIVEAEKLQ